MKDLYVVYGNEWDGGYGAEIYLYGVYDTLKEAQDILDRKKTQLPNINPYFFKIKKVTLNQPEREYLGGYVE